MSKLPEPGYLNLEWWFNKFFELLKAIPGWVLKVLEWLTQFNLRFVSTLLSVILTGGIIFVLYKIYLLHRRKIPTYLDFFAGEELPESRTKRWDEIKRHLDSENPSEWKQAIIEADALIDDILKRIGYKGESLGERLKNIEPSDFDSLQDVWEAHKARNRIVHEVDFKLTKDEAKKIVEKYEKALKELKYI